MVRSLMLAVLLASPSIAAEPAHSNVAALFGARPAVSQVSLSPDGKRVAFVTPLSGQGGALFVVETEEGAQPKRVALASANPERLAECRWASTERLICLIYGQKPRADMMAPGGAVGLPFESLVAIPAGGGDVAHAARQVSLGFGIVTDWLPDERDVVLVRGFGTARYDIATGKRRALEPLGASGTPMTDGSGTVRIIENEDIRLINGTGSGVVTYRYRAPGATSWKPLSTYTRTTAAGFAPLAVDPATNLAWGIRKVDGRFAIFTKALDADGAERQVFARPDVDVAELVRIGRRQRIVGVRYVTYASHVHYTDPSLATLAEQLAKALPETPNISIVDASDDERKLLIFAASDLEPGLYYVLDRDTKQLHRLMNIRPQLEGIKLAPVRFVTYPATDGTSIPAYLTVPNDNPHPGRAIVLPHGGPSARDEWGFNWLAQFFAARGYAVLQPNYRGSAGYGDQFLSDEGFRQWRVAVGDIDAGARWLVAQDIAAPNRLAIFGWSYGGYAALQAGDVDPTLYRAIVAVAPVTDLGLLRGLAAHSSNRAEVFQFLGSDPSGEASPTSNAGRISAPVMLVHGTFDLNVAYEHSKRMAARLTAAGRKPEVLVFPGLDHQLDDATARSGLLERADAFVTAAFSK